MGKYELIQCILIKCHFLAITRLLSLLHQSCVALIDHQSSFVEAIVSILLSVSLAKQNPISVALQDYDTFTWPCRTDAPLVMESN